MNMKKTMLVTGAATIVGLTSFAGAAAAATTSTSGDQSLAAKIAAKFNLNKSDVQAVIDEDRQAHEAEHQAKLEERLNQAVKDGKITSAQKDQILAKHEEMKAFMDSLKDKSEDERATLMKQKLAEIKQWAADNGLTDYMPFGKGGPGFGRGDIAPPDDVSSSPNNS